MYSNTEFVVALVRVREQIKASFPQTTLKESLTLREYAKAHTDLASQDLTAEQAAWKLAYEKLITVLRQDAPALMQTIEALESDAAVETAFAEISSRIGTKPQLTFEELYELREYAKSRIHVSSDSRSREQELWKALYESWTELLRETDPDTMRKLEPMEEAIELDEKLARAFKQADMDSSSHDYGSKVLYGSLVAGGLIGWIAWRSLWPVVFAGLISWIAGLLLSIFALRSPYVHVWTALRLERLGFKRPARWLYHRIVTTR